MFVRRTAVSALLAAGLTASALSPAFATTATQSPLPVVHVTSKVTVKTAGAHGHFERTVFSKITGVKAAVGKKILARLNETTLVATTPSGDQVPGDLELDDIVKLARADVHYVTFHQDDYSFGWGATHGITFDDPLTFSRSTGELLDVTDWIKKGDQKKFLAALSTYTHAYLKAHADAYSTDASFYDDGTKPTLANFSSYEVTTKGWVVHFSQYQVAPYVAGNIHITVPWSKLKGLTALPHPTA